MAEAVEHTQSTLPNLTAEPGLNLSFVMELISKLQGGEDHVGLGGNLPIAFERAYAGVDQLRQRVHVGFVRIAAYQVRLSGDTDFDRALHCGPEQYRRDD